MKIGEITLTDSAPIQKAVKTMLFESKTWQGMLVNNPDRAKQVLQETITDYEVAFKELPHAMEYLDKKDLSGYRDYTQDKLDDAARAAKGLTERLDHCDKIFFIYKEHLAKEPKLRLTPNREDMLKYLNYYERLGYLGALVDSAQAKVHGYKKHFWDPAKKTAEAVQFLEPYFDRIIEDLSFLLKPSIEKQNRERFKWGGLFEFSEKSVRDLW